MTDPLVEEARERARKECGMSPAGDRDYRADLLARLADRVEELETALRDLLWLVEEFALVEQAGIITAAGPIIDAARQALSTPEKPKELSAP